MSGLPVTGNLDRATLLKMRQPRCGVEDPFNQKSFKYRRFGGKHLLPDCLIIQSTFSTKFGHIISKVCIIMKIILNVLQCMCSALLKKRKLVKICIIVIGES